MIICVFITDRTPLQRTPQLRMSVAQTPLVWQQVPCPVTAHALPVPECFIPIAIKLRQQ